MSFLRAPSRNPASTHPRAEEPAIIDHPAPFGEYTGWSRLPGQRWALKCHGRTQEECWRHLLGCRSVGIAVEKVVVRPGGETMRTFSNNTIALLRAYRDSQPVAEPLHDSLLEDGFPGMAKHALHGTCQGWSYSLLVCDLTRAHQVATAEKIRLAIMILRASRSLVST